MVQPNLGMINSFAFPRFFVFFPPNIVTEIHSSHLKGTASPLSQLISLSPSIRPSCFSFSLLPCIHLVPGHPPTPLLSPQVPALTMVFPKSSAIRHLQWINYTVLTQLDWACNTDTPPPRTQTLPAHIHPLQGPGFFLGAIFSSFTSVIQIPSVALIL